jgi:Dyp-type peroxidase family
MGTHLNHNEKKLSKDRSLRTTEIWEHMQRGLVYPSPHAIFAGFSIKESKKVSRADLRQLKIDLRERIHVEPSDDLPSLKNSNSTAILGAGVLYWTNLCKEEGLSIPKGLKFKYPDKNGNTSTVISRSSHSFQNDNIDLWFHIKSDVKENCEYILDFIKEKLGDKVGEPTSQDASSKSTSSDGKGGKVLGSRFSENLNNPTDPLTVSKHCLVGAEDMEHFGASYVLAQRFKINWDQVHSMSENQIEDIIGRKTDDTIIPDRDTRTHIKSARRQDKHGNTTPLLRLGLPFGESTHAACPYMVAHGSNIADEAGIYFAGYTKSLSVLETIMDHQIGNMPDFMNDRLFNNVKSDFGGFFYIPSIKDLNLDTGEYLESQWKGKKKLDWSRFPGIDWTRLDRHFDKASENGLMHYNHKEYLYSMSTMSEEEKKEKNPPSNRILSLLENSFSRWQDNWYVDRKQEEFGHITEYIKDFKKNYPNCKVPDNIMDESIMVRKGWSIRLTLHEMASKKYGFRGQMFLNDDKTMVPVDSSNDPTKGRVINGADTFRIQPEEIIVGGMPNLSLGEGRYCMLYLSEEERMDGFLANLSEASGVGHNIPGYEEILEKGIEGVIEKITLHNKDGIPKEKQQFYTSCWLSMKGVQEYALCYARLAKEMAEKMPEGQIWERNNLLEIYERMKHIAFHPPRNLTEAIQLIFTVHASLHLTGEPVAFGRLDQILASFYDKDIKDGVLTSDEAQEVLDAFCVKLDEKVQSNRLFVDDHQPFGNLAMGGSAGPYPQGASINQWIMQVTVGGCDPKTGKSSYNDLTKMFIRSIARMPLNAPCLSLRMREDIPKDILDEAAKAVLSGGAHPIFLNDYLFIDGLQQSGNSVGGNYVEGKTWDSKVSIESARNYACDGCFEPQFPGENWFSLGGFSTLEPLECAMNRGKTYSSAGSNYFRGKVVSLTTRPAEQITEYKDLEELYFQHFELLNKKRIDGQLMGFGANTAFCPAPLLSVLIDDCIAKGMDYYSGGAKYNIYGPCYVALSATINSLWAIKQMVYNDKKAVTSLPELLDCLSCDWGHEMSEPFVSEMAGEARATAQADRYKRLREVALSLPRYGRGNKDVDKFGNEIIGKIADIALETFTNPLKSTGEKFASMADNYGTKDHPFGIQIQPGVGTFENHVEMGAWNGASADGRRKGTTVASDMSSMPSPADLPVDHQNASFKQALAGYAIGDGVKKMTDGGPTDFNIREDYPKDDLVEVLKQFALGKSSNILTITVADPNSMEEAMSKPEQYDLLRVRTGGWTAYFTAMFPNIQEQHKRRPLSTAE